MHVALALFLAGLVLFLFPLNEELRWITGTITAFTYLLYLISVLLPLVKIQCAYHTPLTRYFHQLVNFTSLLGEKTLFKARVLLWKCYGRPRSLKRFMNIPDHKPFRPHPAATRSVEKKPSLFRLELQAADKDLFGRQVSAFEWLWNFSNNTAQSVVLEALSGLYFTKPQTLSFIWRYRLLELKPVLELRPYEHDDVTRRKVERLGRSPAEPTLFAGHLVFSGLESALETEPENHQLRLTSMSHDLSLSNSFHRRVPRSLDPPHNPATSNDILLDLLYGHHSDVRHHPSVWFTILESVNLPDLSVRQAVFRHLFDGLLDPHGFLPDDFPHLPKETSALRMRDALAFDPARTLRYLFMQLTGRQLRPDESQIEELCLAILQHLRWTVEHSTPSAALLYFLVKCAEAVSDTSREDIVALVRPIAVSILGTPLDTHMYEGAEWDIWQITFLSIQPVNESDAPPPTPIMRNILRNIVGLLRRPDLDTGHALGACISLLGYLAKSSCWKEAWALELLSEGDLLGSLNSLMLTTGPFDQPLLYDSGILPCVPHIIGCIQEDVSAEWTAYVFQLDNLQCLCNMVFLSASRRHRIPMEDALVSLVNRHKHRPSWLFIFAHLNQTFLSPESVKLGHTDLASILFHMQVLQRELELPPGPEYDLPCYESLIRLPPDSEPHENLTNRPLFHSHHNTPSDELLEKENEAQHPPGRWARFRSLFSGRHENHELSDVEVGAVS